MTPQELARYYERCMARARGAAAAGAWGARDPEAAAFADWMAQFWAKTCPVAPTTPPDAISAVAGTAGEMRWCRQGGAILASVADDPRGCYRIPCGVEPPDPAPPGATPSRPGCARR